MTKKLKYFTIKAANQLIPTLVPVLNELRTLRNLVDKIEVEVDSLEIIAEGTAKDSNASGNVEAKISELNDKIGHMNELINRIEEFGCSLRSIEWGLVDFLSQAGGRDIFLCWQFDENTICSWHEVGEGCQERKPLS